MSDLPREQNSANNNKDHRKHLLAVDYKVVPLEQDV